MTAGQYDHDSAEERQNNRRVELVRL